MPSIKDLKKRIGTVKNTQQTTKAMKMVSAAKLRRAQDAILSQRPYAQSLNALLTKLARLSGGRLKSPYFEGGRANDQDRRERRVLLVLVTSDRGLCGGFNSSIIKAGIRTKKEWLAKGATVHLGFVGRRGHDFFKTKESELGPFFSEVTGKVEILKAKALSESLKELYLKGSYDEIKFIYNEFKNAVSQVVRVEDFLPISSISPKADGTAVTALPDTIVKPNVDMVFNDLMAKIFTVQSFKVLLESQASEHGARMSAMENATKNAGEMIRKLTLQYNKQRQAGITKELLEIISGSEAQKN